MDKILTLDAAAALVEPGATVGIGGSITTRKPIALVRTIAESGVDELTLVSFTGSIAIDLLVGAGAAATVASGYMGLGHYGRAPHFVAAVESGNIVDLEYTEWLLLQRLRAAAMGAAFIPTRAATGSAITDLHGFARIEDPYTDDELIALPPLQLDVTILHCWRASAEGYVQFAEPPDHLWDIDTTMARAASHVIVTVDELVDVDTIRKTAHLTQLFPVDVTAVVPTENGSWPTSSRPNHAEDGAALREYAATGVLPS